MTCHSQEPQNLRQPASPLEIDEGCCSSPPQDDRKVRFGSIQVYEHERILDGDTHVCMGLAIGWNYNTWEVLDVENLRKEHGHFNETKDKMKRTTGHERMNVLLKYGYTVAQIGASTKRRKCRIMQAAHAMKHSKTANSLVRTTQSRIQGLLKTMRKRKVMQHRQKVFAAQ